MAWQYALGVIGTGNMGRALVSGIVRAQVLQPEQVLVADPAPGSADRLAQELGVAIAPDNVTLVQQSEYVFLVVKPSVVVPVLREIDGVLTDQQVLVSFAAGISLARIADTLTARLPLVRVMPNTPALVGLGAFAFAAPGVGERKSAGVRRLLEPLGLVVSVEEKLMDAATGLIGSGPAFVFVLIEALADGGVAAGLPRAVALRFAAQTVLGAAKMALETEQHPGQLKDMVASPGGTTIAGLAVLEESGFRSALINAVQAAAKRAHELSEEK